MKKLKLITMALIGVFFMPLLFSVPAHAAPADWNIVDLPEGAGCEFLEEEFSISAQDCDEGGITLHHSDFGAGSKVSTDAVASQTWRSKYTLELDDDSVLTRVQYGYVPVCHVNGQIHKSGDMVSFEAQVSDEDIQHEMALNPTWSACGLGQDAALLQFSYLEEGIDLEEVEAPYTPSIIAGGDGDHFVRGFLTEYGLTYMSSYLNDEDEWRYYTLVDFRKSTLEIAFPNFDFSDWVDISAITATSENSFNAEYYDALNSNAEILYGENFVPSTSGNNNQRNIRNRVAFRTLQPGTGISVGGSWFSLLTGTSPAYANAPLGIDWENRLSNTCVINTSEGYRVNPDAAVCRVANSYYIYDHWSQLISMEYFSPRLGSGSRDDESRFLYGEYDFENLDDQTNSSLKYSLIEPSSASVSGPIVQEERVPGIDEEEIEAAGGYTSIGDVYDAAVDGFPAVQWTDCDAEGLGWFSCFVSLVQDVISWVGDIIAWLFNLLWPSDIDYFAWINAVYGGFENSDPYYYSVGTIEYIQSQFGGRFEYGTFDGTCAPIETGFIDMDFCTVKDAPGYGIAMGMMSAVLYVLGFITIFRLLYRFFAPKTDLSSTVSPSTAKRE